MLQGNVEGLKEVVMSLNGSHLHQVMNCLQEENLPSPIRENKYSKKQNVVP
jgi:hypothetical protein